MAHSEAVKAAIKGTTQLLGVIGHPVEHSFSPLMHNAAISHLNADYVYLPFPIRPEALKNAIAGFAAIGLKGFNITLPHKQAIIPLLDEVSDVAKAIGAVNTVWRSEDERWCGTNTDVTGFLAPLQTLASDLTQDNLTQDSAKDWLQTPALILGNGGAARAVVAGCHQLGCPKIWVAGRSPDKLTAFAQSWSAVPDIAARLQVISWDTLTNYLPQAGLIVNSTPVGMHPHAEASPLSSAEIGQLTPGSIAYDLIYTPRPTRFLSQASQAGLVGIDGLEMLVQQGAAALKIWLGQPVPIDIMRQALLTHLAQANSR